MREVLCRAKSIENNQWVEGYYVMHQKRMVCPIGDKLKDEELEHFIFFDSFSDWSMPRTLACAKIEVETLGSLTNVIDKTGQRIFEGDILEITEKNFEGKWSVKWDESKGRYLIQLGKGGIYANLDNRNKIHIEVVGNIYDNPELMEG